MFWIVLAHMFIALTVLLTMFPSVWRQASESRVNLDVIMGVALFGMLSALFLNGRGYFASELMTVALTFGIGRLALSHILPERPSGTD
jgi:hypothetical protein